MLRRFFTMSTAAAALALGATPAAAFVAVYVDNYSPLAGSRNFQGYNVTSDQFFNHFVGESGPSTLNYCFGNSCAFGNDGTQDPSGKATAAFVTASMSDVDQGGPSSGSGSARADLASGELGVASTGTYRPIFGMNSGITPSSFASFNDILHFTVAGADASTRTSVGVRLEIDGTQTRVDPNASGYVQSYLNLGGGLLYAGFEFDRQIVNGPLIYTAGSNYFDSYTVAGTAENLVLTGYFTVRGAMQDAEFGEFLSARCGGGVTCLYGNTAKVSLLLPAGVTFTSDSGVFLNGAPAVPEPTTWSLLIAGFGLTGGVLRRRRFTTTA